MTGIFDIFDPSPRTVLSPASYLNQNYHQNTCARYRH